MSPGVQAWLFAFAWTLVFELPVYVGALRGRCARWWSPVAIAVGVNVASHPAFSFWVLSTRPGPAAIGIAEVLIAVAEAALVRASCRSVSMVRALLLAAAANSLSLGLGLLLFR